MEELISDTQEQYNKKELKYQDFVHNGEIIPASKKDRVQQSIEAAIMQSIAPVSHKLAQKSIKEKEQNNADVIDNILNEDAA
ncbi:MAG: hypothetical protein U9Q15_02780 [Patescibacteria group bacterium]|nr:hypothetical protein [Patescibacteria group bacterium]